MEKERILNMTNDWDEYLYDIDPDDNAESYNEFAERMRAQYANQPLVAMVSQPNGAHRYYGPFSNGDEAMEWLRSQPARVPIGFLALRNPWTSRKHQDFYSFETENTDKEYKHNVVAK